MVVNLWAEATCCMILVKKFLLKAKILVICYGGSVIVVLYNLKNFILFFVFSFMIIAFTANANTNTDYTNFDNIINKYKNNYVAWKN